MSAPAASHRRNRFRAGQPAAVTHRPRPGHRAAWPPHTLDEAQRDPRIVPVHRTSRRASTAGRRLLGGGAAQRKFFSSSATTSTGGGSTSLRDMFRFWPADFLRTAAAISNAVNWLLLPAGKLVRVLRKARLRMTSKQLAKHGWHGPADVRIICDCQRHALRERTLWRRSLRAASRFKRGGVMLLVGLPLAFGTIDFPMNAGGETTVEARAMASLPNSFRIFSTPKVRAEFLAPQVENRVLTLEVTKEEFFRTKVPYGAIIYREANRNRLPPELVAAVVEAESDFRPRLISGKNAKGLMQIIPSTGDDLGVGNLFDPEQNVAAGSRYLRYLLDRFGSLHLALAAYNAGEGNIEKFGGIPPFPETQNYIQRVSSTTKYYRQRVRDTYLVSSRIPTSYAH